MKKLLLASLMMALAASPLWAQQSMPCDDRSKIAVTGEALVTARPDKIVVTFGIETWDKDVLAAKQKNGDILTKAMAAIKTSGVPEKDVQTDYLSVQPRYKSDYTKEDFIGYFVRNTLAVTLSHPEKVDDLVTRVLQSGVNYIQGVDFQTTEFKKYREQARELAIKAAREKAEKMASALGKAVGAPIQISENSTPWGYFSSWSWWGGARPDQMSQNAVQNVQGTTGEANDSAALGKVSIRASVSVTFELKK